MENCSGGFIVRDTRDEGDPVNNARRRVLEYWGRVLWKDVWGIWRSRKIAQQKQIYDKSMITYFSEFYLQFLKMKTHFWVLKNCKKNYLESKSALCFLKMVARKNV